MGGNNFILTSNRDEKDSREIANPPKKYLHYHLNVMYPQDPRAKGTWIAASENGFTLCLLNGAFMAHKSKPAYRKSRGVVLLDFYKFCNVNQFVVNYDFKGIEPFTLIIVEFKSAIKLYELRWDGKQMHLSFKNSKKSHIWSSVTLYAPEIIAEREKWFDKWKKEQSDYTADSIKNFHQNGGKGDKESDILMKREGAFTVSLTQVVKNDTEIVMNYTDCINQLNTTLSMVLA